MHQSKDTGNKDQSKMLHQSKETSDKDKTKISNQLREAINKDKDVSKTIQSKVSQLQRTGTPIKGPESRIQLQVRCFNCSTANRVDLVTNWGFEAEVRRERNVWFQLDGVRGVELSVRPQQHLRNIFVSDRITRNPQPTVTTWNAETEARIDGANAQPQPQQVRWRRRRRRWRRRCVDDPRRETEKIRDGDRRKTRVYGRRTQNHRKRQNKRRRGKTRKEGPTSTQTSLRWSD